MQESATGAILIFDNTFSWSLQMIIFFVTTQVVQRKDAM